MGIKFAKMFILSLCCLFVFSNIVIADDKPIIHCPKCGATFEANGSYVGRIGGTVAGAGGGAYIGSGIGLVGGPIGGIAGTIPGAIIGGAAGFWVGGHWDKCKCPKCNHVFDYK